MNLFNCVLNLELKVTLVSPPNTIYTTKSMIAGKLERRNQFYPLLV